VLQRRPRAAIIRVEEVQIHFHSHVA
jgi:hypothetical protein